jgi:hypothetical protein
MRITRLLLLSVLVASTASAQSAPSAPPLRQLTSPLRTIGGGFTAVSRLRELPNGQVIIANTRARTLQRIDPRTGASTPVGRQGGGPREWGTIRCAHDVGRHDPHVHQSAVRRE